MMKKHLPIALFMSAFVGIQNVAAQSWTPSAPSNGTYYLYNVSAGQFLCSGCNWGSRASLNPNAAMSLTLAASGSGYTISTSPLYNSRYLGSDGYMDNGSSAVWVFESVNANEGTYRLKNGSNYLNWSGSGTYTTTLGTASENGVWRLVTRDNLVANLENASESNPVDATFLIENSWFAKGNGCNAGSGIDACVPYGWSGTIVTDYWGNDGGDETVNYCIEQYGKTFNNYQTLSVPNGEYTLSAQGFYRTGSTNSGVPYFYANASKESFIPIAEDGPSEAPSNIATAASALRFDTGYYLVEGITAKVVDGTLTVGAKSEESKVDWCAFDNFSLVCTGLYFSASAIELPNDGTTSLTAGQWYYYDVASSGTYTLDGDISGLVYTTNGAQKSGSVSSKLVSSSLALSSGKVYFMTTDSGITFTIAKTSESTSETFSVCALNVDGLPQSILTYDVNPTGPGSDGTKLISSYLSGKGYDFIAVSEDFNYNGSLTTYLGDYTSGTWRGGLDASSLTSAILSGGKVDTDGLNFFCKNSHSFSGERWTSWNTTYGNLSAGFDENVDKGFRYYKVTLNGGTIIDVYTLHMDAETAAEDIAARETQLTQLANEIVANKTGRPKIVMGDTNCRYTRDQLKTLFVDVINNNSNLVVKDAWVENRRGGTYPTYYSDGDWQHDLSDATQEGGTSSGSYEVVDKIFFINPTSGVQLALQNFYLETDYVDESGTELGDHAPAVAVFSIEGIQVLPTEANDFWEGESETASGTSRYLYNVGSGYYLNETGELVASIDNSTIWNMWGDGDTRTLSTDNNYRLVLGYTLGSGYYCKTQTSSGATSFTLKTGSSRTDAFKLYASSHYVNVNWSDNYTLGAATSEDGLNDWLFISEAQKEAYDDYVDAFNEANLYTDYPLTDDLYNELVEALSVDEVTYSNSAAVTENLLKAIADIKDYFSEMEATEDCTSLLKNPSFEKKNATTDLDATTDGTNNHVYGWTVSSSSEATEAFAAWEDASNSQGRYFTGMDGNHIFNAWSSGGAGTFYCTQDITVDEDGIYSLSAIVASGGGSEGDVTVEMVFGNVTVESPTLTDRTVGVPLSACMYCSAGDTYTVGIKSSQWFKADNFTLARVAEVVPDGDVNTDGSVNVADVIMMLNYILGDDVDNFSFKHADLIQDDVINMMDLLQLISVVAGE